MRGAGLLAPEPAGLARRTDPDSLGKSFGNLGKFNIQNTSQVGRDNENNREVRKSALSIPCVKHPVRLTDGERPKETYKSPTYDQREPTDLLCSAASSNVNKNTLNGPDERLFRVVAA